MKKITIFILLSISSNYFSQNYLGISSSNYAGSMGTDIQPASFVDGRFKFDLNLFSLNFSAYQKWIPGPGPGPEPGPGPGTGPVSGSGPRTR